jgi:ribonuclease BN (tRNA processing enzyme)
MTDANREPAQKSASRPSRRTFLGLIGAGAGAGLVAGVGGATLASLPRADPAPTTPTGSDARTRIVLLGTAAGPQMGSSQRAGISTAIVHGDRYYLIDLGWGSKLRLSQAGLKSADPAQPPFANLGGVFFTHLHSDHVADWAGFYLLGATNAIGRQEPIPVFGPPDRAVPAAVQPPGRPAPELVNPEDPGLGTVGMTSLLRQAFSADLNDRIRDTNQKDPAAVFDVRDIDLAGIADYDEHGVPPEVMTPIPVWTDGVVTVTATLVDHRPTAPALAYRFDTPDGSIVISGDTTVSDNLVRLAEGCDYLLHEVIDPAFVDRLVLTLPEEVRAPLREHLLASHTTIEQVGGVAERAGAKHLVLHHLNPGTTDEEWMGAQEGYSGQVIVGSDLLTIPVTT